MRSSQGILLAVQSLVIIGVISNRVTLAVPSLVAASNGSYFPGWMEFAITLALLTGGVVAFAFAAKHLPVFGGTARPCNNKTSRVSAIFHQEGGGARNGHRSLGWEEIMTSSLSAKV